MMLLDVKRQCYENIGLERRYKLLNITHINTKTYIVIAATAAVLTFYIKPTYIQQRNIHKENIVLFTLSII